MIYDFSGSIEIIKFIYIDQLVKSYHACDL